jgi:hypothetical protein
MQGVKLGKYTDFRGKISVSGAFSHLTVFGEQLRWKQSGYYGHFHCVNRLKYPANRTVKMGFQ